MSLQNKQNAQQLPYPLYHPNRRKQNKKTRSIKFKSQTTKDTNRIFYNNSCRQSAFQMTKYCGGQEFLCLLLFKIPARILDPLFHIKRNHPLLAIVYYLSFVAMEFTICTFCLVYVHCCCVYGRTSRWLSMNVRIRWMLIRKWVRFCGKVLLLAVLLCWIKFPFFNVKHQTICVWGLIIHLAS